MNPAVHFVTQAISERESRRELPGVLKVKVISLAPDIGLVKVLAGRREGRRHHRVVRERGGGEESRKGVGKWIARLNIMLAICRGNIGRRIRGATTKGVRAVRVHSKDGRVAVEADLHTEFQRVSPVRVDEVLPRLVEISVCARSSPGSRVERLVKTVGERHGGLGVIGRKKERRAANVSERGLGSDSHPYTSGFLLHPVASSTSESR